MSFQVAGRPAVPTELPSLRASFIGILVKPFGADEPFRGLPLPAVRATSTIWSYSGCRTYGTRPRPFELTRPTGSRPATWAISSVVTFSTLSLSCDAALIARSHRRSGNRAACGFFWGSSPYRTIGIATLTFALDDWFMVDLRNQKGGRVAS